MDEGNLVRNTFNRGQDRNVYIFIVLFQEKGESSLNLFYSFRKKKTNIRQGDKDNKILLFFMKIIPHNFSSQTN